MEKIVCSAIYFNDGKKYAHQPVNIDEGIVICGLRHCNCFAVMGATALTKTTPNVQGFLTSKNRFVDRKEAFKIAYTAKQLKHIHSPGLLFSEDLY